MTAFDVTIEQMLRGGLDAPTSTTHANGGFAIDGLLAKEYRLRAAHTPTLRQIETEPIAAGARDVVITLPATESCVRVAGRVVGHDGKPLEGLVVIPCRDSEHKGWPQVFGEMTMTDAEGRFEFARLALGDLGFQINGERVFMEIWRPIRADEKPDELAIVVSRQCHVQADLSNRPEFADSFSALDVLGANVRFLSFEDGSSSPSESIEITNGRSDVVATEEQARTIVFTKAGKEVGRMPITLVPSQVNIVRP